MKILLISVKSNRSRGGIATWTERFLPNCNRFDISCDVVNTEAVGKRVEQGSAKRNIFDEISRTRRIFKELKCFLKKEKYYDAVHLNTSCGTFGLFRDYLVARRVKKCGLRLITHFHCDIPYWMKSSLSRKFLCKLVDLSDERLVLCENSRVYLEKNCGVTSVKMPNFIDESVIRQDEKLVSQKVSKAFFVGRISVAKGAKEMYELAKRLPDITFELVGDVSDAVSVWDKPDNIVLVGGVPHDEVLTRIDQADIFVFPTHSEGFSLALTEAMARGLPSVATDVGANADMLDGGCGIVTSVGDVDAMEKAIRQFDDKEVRQKMSSSAVKKVRAQYATDIIINKLKQYYLGGVTNEQG